MIKEFLRPSGLLNVAATELSLACHSWRNFYEHIDRDLGNRINKFEGKNIWEKIAAASKHQCTQENIDRFKPLFVDQAIRTKNRIDGTILRYGDVLPDELRVLSRQAIERLELSSTGYDLIYLAYSDIDFQSKFKQVIKALSELELPAHDLQKKTNP